ncbi:hypothetical protein EIN_264120 [Entamoeba invadens IP1]|uniref:Uncharacterized protein n=1 Tax=Entamoeba invadens IP1 TaxID=370355 RepID=L7FQA2_ENTIV|nr:hypothetical protein EIN_264120 [Entamoeba invadens IP1]ELP92968.1 hypothetical protein EIN_264120 [Entamoeba invadens IP1]|eukprot:XP_004259739.1 hypothetical protein EIN_264120 [Entamoeba invadens IP1]
MDFQGMAIIDDNEVDNFGNIPEVHGPDIDITLNDNLSRSSNNLCLTFLQNILITFKFMWKFCCDGLCDSIYRCTCICDFFSCFWCDVTCCHCFLNCNCCNCDYYDDTCECPFYSKYCCVPFRLIFCCNCKHTCCENCSQEHFTYDNVWDYVFFFFDILCECFVESCVCLLKPFVAVIVFFFNLICCTYCTYGECNQKCAEGVGCVTCGCCGNRNRYSDVYHYVWDCGCCKEKWCFLCNCLLGDGMCVCTPLYIFCCQWMNFDCHTCSDENVECCGEDSKEQCEYACKCDLSRKCCDYNLRLLD